MVLIPVNMPSTGPAEHLIDVSGPVRDSHGFLVEYTAPVEANVIASRAESTVSTYRKLWAYWLRWAAQHGISPIPASPQDVAAYLTALQQADYSLSSVKLYASTISTAHRDAGQVNPCDHMVVKQTLGGISKTNRRRPRQAAALTADALAAIRATACISRYTGKRLETECAARRRGLADIAICCVASDAGLRRSEMSGMVWADVSYMAEGAGDVTVWRSKTDQTGEGEVAALKPSTMAALEAIRPDPCYPEESVFGLSPKSIARRIAEAARAAGIGDGFSGHSGRVGLARRMTAAGAPTHSIMKQGRWKSHQMVARYARHEEAAAALRWL